MRSKNHIFKHNIREKLRAYYYAVIFRSVIFGVFKKVNIVPVHNDKVVRFHGICIFSACKITFSVNNINQFNVLITTETAWYNADIEFAAEYRAVFQNGYIEARNGDVTENHKKVDFSAMNTENQTVGLNIAATDGYKYEIEYFLSCIENNRAPQFVTLESTLNTKKLAETLVHTAKIY